MAADVRRREQREFNLANRDSARVTGKRVRDSRGTVENEAANPKAKRTTVLYNVK